jgi:hypothetical protein
MNYRNNNNKELWRGNRKILRDNHRAMRVHAMKAKIDTLHQSLEPCEELVGE